MRYPALANFARTRGVTRDSAELQASWALDEVDRLEGDLEHADVEREAWRKHAERLEAQLESVRAELAATAARIAAWDEVLETCLPALDEQMTPTRAREAGL